MDGTYFVNTHIEKCNPILQKAWYLLHYAVQSQERDQKDMYLQHFWEAIEEYYDHIAQYKGFQCGKGCSYCCFDNPHGVSSLEVRRIIPRLNKNQKERITSYMEEWDNLTHESSHDRQQTWKKECNPCPLLESGACSVYDVRPLACRSFFSIHHPEWCHPQHPNFQQQPQVGHDDLHSLLEELSIQYGWSKSKDLISELYYQLQEEHS